LNIYISRHFRFSEFACPCCGKDRPIDPKLIYLLQSLREKIDRPIYISKGGGIRCKKYNKQIGGYVDSPHLYGKAADCKAKNISLIDFAREARGIGFPRVGLYKTFLHLDIIKPYPSASWCRDKEGKYHYFKTLEDSISFAKTIQLW